MLRKAPGGCVLSRHRFVLVIFELVLEDEPEFCGEDLRRQSVAKNVRDDDPGNRPVLILMKCALRV